MGEFGPAISEIVTPPCTSDLGLFIQDCNHTVMSKSGVIVVNLRGTTGAGGRVSGDCTSTMAHRRVLTGRCCPFEPTRDYQYEAFHGHNSLGWAFPWNEQQNRQSTLSWPLWVAGRAMERTYIVNTTRQQYFDRWITIEGGDANMCHGISQAQPIGPGAELHIPFLLQRRHHSRADVVQEAG